MKRGKKLKKVVNLQKKSVFLLILLVSFGIVLAASSINIPLSFTTTNQKPTITLLERNLSNPHPNNYSFQGEVFRYKVNVTDPDGTQDILDVYFSLNDSIESNCALQYNTSFTQRVYLCIYTVEPINLAHGLYDFRVNVKDKSNQTANLTIEQNFINPALSISLSSNPTFPNAPAGSIVYSNNITINNTGEDSILIRFKISGKDLADSLTPSALCPDSNVLRLTNIKYYAQKGILTTTGYESIPYEQPANISNRKLILNTTLSTTDSMILGLQLSVPIPCIGSYASNQAVLISGEAV